MLCVSFSIWAHKNSPFHYAHFLPCDALPIARCYRPIYTAWTWSMFSPFLARIAKGFPLTCVESHLAVSQWQWGAFELGYLWKMTFVSPDTRLCKPLTKMVNRSAWELDWPGWVPTVRGSGIWEDVVLVLGATNPWPEWVTCWTDSSFGGVDRFCFFCSAEEWLLLFQEMI